MRTDFDQIRAKVDYLLARDDMANPANVREKWVANDGFREPLSSNPPQQTDHLLDALADRHLGQLIFYSAANRSEWSVDESETEWEGEDDWICIGQSGLATTTAILLHSQTGETVLYDSDAWDWELWDNFILLKDSLAAFVNDVALGHDYRRLYYQNWVELSVVLRSDDLEFPGIYGDPWYHLLREMQADLFGGQPVSRTRRKELLRRIDEYFEV
ncbi:hypothetical protein [Actinomadura algeriensis]|uniref:SUKH-4 immunity protein of toxin-antitoxin system n=1 Tax=Actinomadura algeriensis TaxID=1679523 RepID=A0ABR9JPG9_9ACTN|nr:hypothetical protein [Actinomadura algeriensis]MBE1532464.1 hypothetical protein [Actinomadura algeriensis]